jgi:AraC-like DNA-binding protein
MNSIFFLDFIILVGSLQGLFLALLLWRNKRFHKTANRFLALAILAFSVNNASYIINQLPYFQDNHAISWLPLRWSFLIPVSIYFYVIYLINPSRKFTIKDFLFFIPFFIQFCVQVTQYISRFFWEGKITSWFKFLNIITHTFNSYEEYISIGFSLLFLIASLIKLKKYETFVLATQSNLKTHSLKWLYKLMIIIFGLWLLWFIPYLLEPLFGLNGKFTHYPLWICMSIFNYWIGYSAYFKDDVFRAATVSEKVGITKQNVSSHTRQLYDSLLEDLVNSKLFKDPDLDLQFLADKYGVSTGHLSRVINHHFQNSFYHLVNYYRIEEVKKMLDDKKYNNLTILGIAFDCGFNSKSTFNSVFKQFTGLTPSGYKKGAIK